MRITAGFLKGRRLSVPDIAGIRPTPSRTREALFNILFGVEGWRVLDLFAGSGLMALETISRGAAQVISIERNARVCRHLRNIRQDWQLSDHWRIMQCSVEQGLAELSGEHFDLVFADPPYAQGYSANIPAWLDQHQILCSHLVIEEASDVHLPAIPGWTHMQARRYGGTCLNFFKQETV